MESSNLPTIAVVMPCYNEEASIQISGETIRGILDSLIRQRKIANNSFIYFVDDGSTDSTWHEIQKFHQSVPHVKATKLSRNFGHQAALLSGLNAVTNQCDAVISLDVDLQQDPQAIPEFIQKFMDGNEVVLGVRYDRDQDSWFKRKSANLFYRFSELMGLHIIQNHADYRLLGKKALVALNEYKEPNLFLRALCLNLGFQSAQVEFQVHERKFGSTKYTFTKMLTLALHGITSFSIRPLRFVAAIGLFIFLIALCMSAYALWSALFTEKTVPGWASTVIPIYFIGGIQLLCLGVVGEYVGQIYMTTKQRPRWISESTLD